MAKKKRKQYIKLNNKIREIFDNQSFDEGVTTLSDDELLELVMLLDINTLSLHRNESIRSLRKAWSEGQYGYRKAIVDHLSGKRDIKKKEKESRRIDKVEKILHLLSMCKHTKDEENEVLASFLDLKERKITKEKIESKLHYIRLSSRVAMIEQATNVKIDNEFRLGFLHSFEYRFENIDFNKKLLCQSQSIDFSSLWNQSDDSICDFVSQQKESIVKSMQSEIDNFIKQYLESKSPIIPYDHAVAAIKTMSPEESPICPPLDISLICSLLKQDISRRHIHETVDHVIVQEQREYSLFGHALKYNIAISFEKRQLFCALWQNSLPEVSAQLEAKKATMEQSLLGDIELLLVNLREMATGLDLDESIYEDFIINFAFPHIEKSATLAIREKNVRRVVFHFKEYISPLIEKRKREELLAKSIRDFKSLFTLARSLKRRIIFHVGPTNSGKTYAALQELKNATTGYYLAPLRLLALEGYEDLKSNGVHVSLITGEEEIIDEESTHISSTIEMMNGSVDVDVCVIDEIQMINDRDRGWAWANALIGVPAKTVILTGSYDALDAVTQLCEYLEEELEVVHFKRKNQLLLDHVPTPLNKIKPQTAVIAFSRRDVLSIKQQLSSKYSVSVVYGNLSPEVRREEARRFRDGASSILVATDAIAMGLNLPIKHVLFSKDNKFDGIRRRDLLPSEVQQIAGRAGRYGLEEYGYVGALNESMLKNISNSFSAKLTDISLPVSVMANIEHAMLISDILQSDNIGTILGFFADNMEFDGPFVAANMDSMLEIASIVDNYNLDIKTKYYLCCAPASISSAYIESVFNRYIKQIEAQEPVSYIPSRELPSFAQTNEMLLNAEDRVREISLYLWLSFKFPQSFPDTQKAIDARYKLNSFIEKSLRNTSFSKRCTKCNKQLDFSYRYPICDECHNRHKRGYRRGRRSRR